MLLYVNKKGFKVKPLPIGTSAKPQKRNQTADVESADDVDTTSGEDRCLLGIQKRNHYTKNNQIGNRVLNLKKCNILFVFYPQEKEAKLDSKKIQHQTGSSSCTNVWE